MPKRNPCLAAIDIGTNSFHLVIARPDPARRQFRVIDREKERVRLGTGPGDMKRIVPDAMERGIRTLKRFRTLADAAGARVRAVATSAVREALNQRAFIDRAAREAGIRVEVASGLEEARLVYLGARHGLPPSARTALVVDIGGGSTEFVVGRNGRILYANSLKLGALRLTDRFFPGGKVTGRRVRACRAHVAGMLEPVARAARRFRIRAAVGTSGTVQAAAAMAARRRGDPPRQGLNGAVFGRRELERVVGQVLTAAAPGKRRGIPGLDPGRADILPAGLLVLEGVFEALGLARMTVSEYALREGILLDMMEKSRHAGRFHDPGNLRYRSVLALAEHFLYEERHARHVARLALSIFDQTRKLHGLGDAEREYLEAAAILHEVGFFVSSAQHHRHSYYLIRNAHLPGFTEEEKEILANVARYHRKSHPKPKHEGYARLDPGGRRLVARLAAILRIADGLDRSHAGRVRRVACRVGKRRVAFRLSARGPAELEAWGADRKKGLFEETFRRKAVILP